MDVAVGKSGIPALTYKWEIDNWLSYNGCKTNECLSSPPFELLDDTWCLLVYPNGKYDDSKDYVSVCLRRFLKNDDPIELQFTFSIVIEDETIVDFDSKKKLTFDCQSPDQGKIKLVANTAVKERMVEMSADTMKILCQISSESIAGPNDTGKQQDIAMSQHSLAMDSFVNNEYLSDVKFLVKGKEVVAHKMILVAHSPVFAAMFQQGIRGKAQKIVAIEDIGYEAFLDLLRFMYTGKCHFNDHSLLIDLFKAADKYQLLALKSACEERMIQQICMDNALDYLNLADMHNAIDLKKSSLDFIVDHGKQMIQNPGIDELRHLNSYLFNDVLRSIFARVK